MAENPSVEYENELYEVLDGNEVYLVSSNDSDKPSDDEGKLNNRFIKKYIQF